jgi:hypothetical protein
MCELNAGFTTVVGPVGDLEEVSSQWGQIRPPFEGIEPPRLLALGVGDPQYRHPRCPAVLVIRHPESLGGLVADRVEARINAWLPTVSVVTEPGYLLGPAGAPAGGHGGAGAGVTVTPANLNKVAVQLPSATSPRGRKVAVIDTGDGLPGSTVTDFTTGPGPTVGQPPIDHDGHGSAVAELIRQRSPGAQVEALRVCRSGLAVSYEMYLALTYALWSTGRYDVVNVSLSTQLRDACPTPLGKTMSAITEWCTKHRGGLDVHLVTAAGNNPYPFGYPAAVPGAIVVQALDWNQHVASYNTAVPSGLITAQASGGEDAPGQYLGTVTVGGSAQPLFGTSFAAAMVSAELAT